MPGMDKRVEVRCTAEELARWKEAAGAVPLSRWIRLQCERMVDRRVPLVDTADGRQEPPYFPVDVDVPPRVRASLERPAFKPDFGKRLK